LFSFFKRNKINFPVPEWASFFTEEEYNYFLSLVDRYFKKEGIAYTLDDGNIIPADGQLGSNLGLMNVAQHCSQSDRKGWKRFIHSHFDSFKRAAVFDKKLQKIIHDYSLVKKYIGVRLYSKDYIANVGEEHTIKRRITDDIEALLVFDLPHSVFNIQPEQTLNWGKAVDELFEFAISNMKSRYPVKITKEAMGDTTLLAVVADHFFTPNVIFDLASHPSLIGSKGSLVAIPHRHAVLFYPIEDIKVVTTISAMIPVINFMYDKGPGSISPDLYWYHNNKFYLLPYKMDDKELQFIPPENFVDMLNTLG
jgi:hypothetical protein